ncbi:MAG: hypothetical protein ACJAT2_002285 [Bacteriovoracaceae bacterium]
MDLFKVIFLILILASCSAPRPNNLGITEGKLSSCPDKPNCVSSFASKEDEHYLPAIQVISNKERAHLKISGILSKNSSAKIISSTPDYIHAEYTSSVFKFVDDVEFYFGLDKLVHFRSASRTGRSDLGVNKKRIEEIRFKFQQNDF